MPASAHEMQNLIILGADLPIHHCPGAIRQKLRREFPFGPNRIIGKDKEEGAICTPCDVRNRLVVVAHIHPARALGTRAASMVEVSDMNAHSRFGLFDLPRHGPYLR